jgi:hypothetical protein
LAAQTTQSSAKEDPELASKLLWDMEWHQAGKVKPERICSECTDPEHCNCFIIDIQSTRLSYSS